MSTEWSIWKDFGYPGRIVVPGEDGPLEYTFTPTDFARIVRTGNAKLRDGWNVPVCWEHQNVEPGRVRMSQAERDKRFALGVFSHIAGFDVTPRGGGKVLIKGTDPKDLEQVKKVKFVSPEIAWDWQDSDGKTWHGPTVTHLAATPRPVQRHQHAFGTDPDAPYPVVARDLGAAVRLSLAAAAGVGRTLPPTRRLRLALTSYAEPTAMADDNELFGADAGGSGGGGGKKQSAWEKMAASLMEHCGLDLGDVSKINDADTFATILDVAARNFKAGSEPAPEDLNDLPDDDQLQDDADQVPAGDMDTPPPGTGEPPPPVQMSLKKQQERAEALARRNYANEITELERTRRIGPATVEKLKGTLKKVRLSFTANGDISPNGLSAQIDALKELPPNAAWKPNGVKKPAKGPQRTRLSQTAHNKTREVPASEFDDANAGDDVPDDVGSFSDLAREPERKRL